MSLNPIYVGAALVGLGLLVAVMSMSFGSSEPRGVAKSLLLIENSVTSRSAVTTDLAAKDRLVTPLFEKTKGLARALSPSGTDERFTKMLDRAGNPSPWTVERILGAKGVALLVGVLLGVLYGDFQLKSLLYGLLLGAVLFFLPDLLLWNAGMRRQEQTSKSLADALDMLTVCVEAGQGFDAALLQVARNVQGPISGEFARVISEIQIGKSRGEAFSAMGDRVTLPEVKNFVTALVQADRLGLPIAAVLREQTANMRLVRRQKAEEKAQKVTIKILFPLMFCILPALFIVIIGPGAIRMVDAFSHM
ncbi:type II secretion system F family protein [Intrasporangium sp. YIM S08009]|uniref:type II secretion system F family protein n=1 Tax=Intrasporangium zincisolvens TaxID=3080018 RepID=UPI002B059461|nr:type II secretion system F family protein [Intrasporangium sp. YIM S08009]